MKNKYTCSWLSFLRDYSDQWLKYWQLSKLRVDSRIRINFLEKKMSFTA